MIGLARLYTWSKKLLVTASLLTSASFGSEPRNWPVPVATQVATAETATDAVSRLRPVLHAKGMGDSVFSWSASRVC